MQWLASGTADQGVPGSRPGRGPVRCGLELDTFPDCLVLVKPRKPWRTTGTDCDELETTLCLMSCPRDLVFRPDSMDETVLSLFSHYSLIHSLKYVKSI